MTIFRTTTAALLLTTAMTPAWADLSADGVWEQLSALATMDSAADLSFDAPARDGKTLRVENVVLTTKTEVPEGGDLTQVVTYGDVVLTENGDGSVSIMLEDTTKAVMGVEGEGEAEFHVSYDGFKTIVSEDGDMMVYDSTIAKMTGTLIAVPGDSVTTALPHDWLTISDLSSVTKIKDGDVWTLEQDTKTGAVAIQGKFTADEGDGPASVDIDATMAGTNGTFSVVMPKSVDSNDPSELFASDFALSGNFGISGTNAMLDVANPDEQTKIAFSSDATTGNFAMGKDAGFSFDWADNGTSLNVESATMPFPITVSADVMGYGLTMPLMKSDKAPAMFSLDLVNASVNDAIWNMIDPGSNLPRDPVTLRLGVSAMVKLLANLVDEDAMEEMGENPFVPLSAKIDRLEVKAVGLDVNGEGSVEFDQNDMTSYPGMPAPVGDVTVTATGSNALIDRLIKMGLIPEDQAMMTRMMIGMFAESTGEDSIRSHIEFREGGGVYANGQQLR